ncbi:DUF2971 domain-containing protein [Nitrosomonas sp.]|uniref:DUF2971 domain-containing protein n=1 Tax=Nitrosomonas sp. TaxID=42353 RepID=UPI0025D952C0|nr:DUF2971 domain-containing protein [Nitrosomonas sp.]
MGLINIKEITLPIYRILSFDKLVDIFKKQELTLVKPSNWEDPFENCILKSFTIDKDGYETYHGNRDDLYGQCWTSRKDSDAMWRIYSPDKSGVKIKSTVEKILTNLVESVGIENAFIGKVEYRSKKYILGQMKETWNSKLIYQGNDVIENIVKTLLIKRKAFSHESEIRVIYFSLNSKPESDIHPVKIDPFQLVVEIAFDPRINPNKLAAYQHYLKNEIKFLGKINKSPLYDAPSHKIRI